MGKIIVFGFVTIAVVYALFYGVAKLWQFIKTVNTKKLDEIEKSKKELEHHTNNLEKLLEEADQKKKEGKIK